MAESEFSATLGPRISGLLETAASDLCLSVSSLIEAVETAPGERTNRQSEQFSHLTALADSTMRRRKYTSSIVDGFYTSALAGAPGEESFIGGAEALELHGYKASDLECLPEEARTRFLGLGNVWRNIDPAEGARVLDVGCGSGVDLGIAARRVGRSGALIGLDKRPDLLGVAVLACPEAKLLVGEVSELPTDIGNFDLVLANGLPPLQRPNLIEATARKLIARVRPGGTLSATVLVASASVTEEITERFPGRSRRFTGTMATLVTGKPPAADVRSAFERPESLVSLHPGSNPYRDRTDQELTSAINVVVLCR